MLNGRILGDVGRIGENIPQTVDEIMNKDTGVWQLDGISNWISETEQKAIQSIPIHDGAEQDKRVWPKEKSGIYSVKSGYASKKWDLRQGPSDRASSSHQVDRRLWKEIWHIKAPSKVKVFMWRLCRRALATNEELWKRKCIAEPVCVLCGEDVETIEHMLLLCSWTRKVWWQGCCGLKICCDRIRTLDQWLMEIFKESARISREPEVLKTHIAFTCWTIWKARCQAVFEHKAINVDQVVHWIISAVNEFVMIQGTKRAPAVSSKREDAINDSFSNPSRVYANSPRVSPAHAQGTSDDRQSPRQSEQQLSSDIRASEKVNTEASLNATFLEM
ncbi:hypothetical protein COLO4_22747 [Corchorus olitorius]|uniref:Reverse transcriptase zinc-binding domain-containing protein n=1 Tax=Corchorus olitorius TaxID=93759 RepID=A0A1R3IK61_9ROSI|nr:hypothetical protein COLO4_22747 [Corchorus olitorius]